MADELEEFAKLNAQQKASFEQKVFYVVVAAITTSIPICKFSFHLQKIILSNLRIFHISLC